MCATPKHLPTKTTRWEVVQLPSGLYTLRRTWHGWEQEFPLAWRSREWAERHERWANGEMKGGA